MMTSTVAGRMYKGKVHEWTAKKGKKDEAARVMFRGRLNFKDQERDAYHFIDAVCYQDWGTNDGLVGFLDTYFGEDAAEGRAIILNGFIRPTTSRKTIELKAKSGAKKSIPNVPYETFEFVITGATFPPTSQGDSKSKGKTVDADEDFDEDDDFEVVDGADEEAEEVEEKPKRGRTGKASGGAKKPQTSTQNRRRGAKKEEAPAEIEEDDDAIFDEE